MFNSQTTRIPDGVTNAAPWQTFANVGVLDPSWAHVYHNDFDTYLPSDWTITLTGTGTSALAVGAIGGALLATTTAGAADANYYQLVQASFQLTPRETLHFKYFGILSDVTNDVFYAGMLSKSATPLTATDGIYILKATGQAGLTLNSVIGGVTTSTPIPGTLVAGVAFELGLEVDYLGNLAAFFNPGTGGPFTAPTLNSHPGRQAVIFGLNAVTGQSPSAALTQVALSPSFGLLNSTAAARTLTTDYVTVASSR